MKPLFITTLIVLLLTGVPAARGVEAAPSAQQLLQNAKAAYERGDAAEALALMDRAIAAAPRDSYMYFARGALHEDQRDFDKAIADFTRVIELREEIPGAEEPGLYNRRGGVQFKAGRIDASIADFDRAIALSPKDEPHHWQRGISYYYAGRYAEGRKQFESHQAVNPHDVENAVWHYMCVARQAPGKGGPAAAVAALIPIDTAQDARVPMKQIYELFAGKGSAEAVLKAAESGNVTEPLRRNQRFYAHLYLGLWHEAQGDAEKAREHMQKAAEDFSMGHYMGEVARVHWARVGLKQ